MSFTIQTNQTKSLNGIKFTKKQDVLNSIKMFDLYPPFKVFENEKLDITSEFIAALKKENYSFVKIDDVVKKIPKKLQNLMNQNYKKTVILKNYPLRFVTVKDIKSVRGFYELWKNNAITVGTMGSCILFFDLTSKAICTIAPTDINELQKKKIITNSVSEFINAYNESLL